MAAYDLQGMTVSDLRRALIPSKLPEAEHYRRYYGRGLTPAGIEQAIRSAELGLMVDLTDLENESLGLDPHAASVVSKRFGSIACLDYELVAAKGAGIDEDLAEEMADETRQAFAQIPAFSERLYDLAWGLFHGRSGLEIHWDYVASRIPWRPRELSWINPRRLSFDRSRELVLIDTWRQTSSFRPVGLRLCDYPMKFVTWTPRLFATYPEQEGLGPRILYWTFHKRFSWRMRMKLIEIFALGWRIIEPDKESPATPEALRAAFESAEGLAEDAVAQMPIGVRLNVVFPDGETGDLFEMTSDQVDRQISKMVLGNTGTTEGGESNRANSIVQKDEQDIILTRDAGGESERVQEGLVKPFCGLNWGRARLNHAPRFRLRAEAPRDTQKEVQNVQAVLGMGLPVAEQQVRQISGLRRPDEGETYVVQGGGGGVDAMGNALPAETHLVDPNDVDAAADKAGKLEDGGVDQAAANAVADLLAATGVRLTAPQRRGLGMLPPAARSVAVARLLERARHGAEPDLVEHLALRAGIPRAHALHAVQAAQEGRFEVLTQIPGLSAEDALWLAYVAPQRYVVHIHPEE